MLGNAFVVIPFRYYTGQYFAYLIVLDFESTCWKAKKMNYGPEISKLKTKILWLHCPDKSMSREPMRTNMPLILYRPRVRNHQPTDIDHQPSINENPLINYRYFTDT